MNGFFQITILQTSTLIAFINNNYGINAYFSYEVDEQSCFFWKDFLYPVLDRLFTPYPEYRPGSSPFSNSSMSCMTL